MDSTTNSSSNSSEMPIASGAAGRVDVGVDTSKRWAPDGMRAQPVIHQHDSYLLRYQELKELQKKNNILEQRMQGDTDLTGFKNNGIEEERTQENSSEGNTSGKASGGKTSKTSKLCVIL